MNGNESEKSFGELPTLGHEETVKSESPTPEGPSWTALGLSEAETLKPPVGGIMDDGRTDGARRWRPGETILDRYVVEEELGQGGMGVVYGCLDKVGGVRVALKCLPPELSHNSVEMEEVRENFGLVCGLAHPNIAVVRQLEKDDSGAYFLVMDIAEGQNLRKWMRAKWKTGGIPLSEALPVLCQVASALDYAHGRKIVHRDIKPGNVMIAPTGEVKVLDFGLADQIRSSLSRASRVYRGTSGTGPYMSPEQWRGRQQDGKTDQYALAVMAYEMLAGHLPFDNSDSGILREVVLNEEPDPIPSLPAPAMAALLRALSKTAENRFPACSDFVAALSGQQSPTADSNPPSLMWLVVLLLALAVGAGVWGWQASESRKRQAEAAARQAEAQRLAEEVARQAELERQAQEEAARQAEQKRLTAEKKAAEEKAAAEKRAEEERLAREAAEHAAQESERRAQEAEAARKAAEDARRKAEEEMAQRQREWEESQASLEEEASPPTVEHVSGVYRVVSINGLPTQRQGSSLPHQQGGYAGERVTVRAGVNQQKVALRWCPAGTFTMGSPVGEEGRSDGETQHRVTLTRGIWMGETEVTEGLWRDVIVGQNPSFFKKGDDYPVENVSWENCQKFVQVLNSFFPVEGMRWALPTEAQWEYACRAGSTGAYGGTGRLEDMGWFSGNSGSPSHKYRVGQKNPNAWGLYDMHGNVAEWCADWYGPYPSGSVADPTGPSTGSHRVSRGGSRGLPAHFCRSAYRGPGDPGSHYNNDRGLRVALLPVQ